MARLEAEVRVEKVAGIVKGVMVEGSKLTRDLLYYQEVLPALSGQLGQGDDGTAMGIEVAVGVIKELYPMRGERSSAVLHEGTAGVYRDAVFGFDPVDRALKEEYVNGIAQALEGDADLQKFGEYWFTNGVFVKSGETGGGGDSNETKEAEVALKLFTFVKGWAVHYFQEGVRDGDSYKNKLEDIVQDIKGFDDESIQWIMAEAGLNATNHLLELEKKKGQEDQGLIEETAVILADVLKKIYPSNVLNGWDMSGRNVVLNRMELVVEGSELDNFLITTVEKILQNRK